MTRQRKEKSMWFLTLTAGVVLGLIMALIAFWYFFKNTFQ